MAGIGILGGVGVLFLGLACVLLAAITGDRSFDQVGTRLLIGAIPTILAGTIFLDEMQGQK